jgi:hypothetical protein
LLALLLFSVMLLLRCKTARVALLARGDEALSESACCIAEGC